MPRRKRNAEFTVEQSAPPSDALLCGFTNYGLAGLTAVDFLTDQLGLENTGHVTTAGLPSITPFEAGTPTHHTQLFSKSGLDLTILKSELFVPPALGKPLGDEILDWTETNGVDDVAVLEGIRLQHGPEGHQTYFVATEDYQKRRLADSEVTPMARGFLDGVNGALVERGIDSSLGVGVYITPVHEQMPDVEAALRLVETVNDVYDLGVDTGPLEAFAAEVTRYYTELAERYREEAEKADAPADRMYM
ncbi:MAG: proteasome assembly chaperone family protein [Halolamina sp.]